MSTLEEVLLTRHRLSEYHVYRASPTKEHIHITPFRDSTKEPGSNSRSQGHLSSFDYANPACNNKSTDVENGSWFVHRPLLSWHDPPRTLRRGDTKHGEPVCVINSRAFWREWNIQFSSQLSRIIDPRGLVRWENHSSRSNDNNSKTADECAFKGYKVRTWRSWGESGKEYHRQVNLHRKNLHEKGKEGREKEKEEEERLDPVTADEAIQLSWSAPFSGHTRRYEFSYASINFFWEGTRDIPIEGSQDKWARRLMPFSHLKLMAAMPNGEKVFVGQFVCSFGPMKFGRLWIFDSVLERLLDESEEKMGEKGDARKTRLYDLVMATAMCMVIGEWQKRMMVQLVCLLLLNGL
ncbi:hypothetical protein PISL3812_08659 [Talaromyces islandicus]|uniref:Uncharacterized protein n=1 Tax=Talaromyces islandicus TaxID=28573 RepID=A0A0U1M7Q4_TALIS|nr:hypothetical protein PISL3812_08659 [Talaromyces islandicus]